MVKYTWSKKSKKCTPLTSIKGPLKNWSNGAVLLGEEGALIFDWILLIVSMQNGRILGVLEVCVDSVRVAYPSVIPPISLR